MSGQPTAEWLALGDSVQQGGSPSKEVTTLRRQLEKMMAAVQDQSVSGVWLDFLGHQREPVWFPSPYAAQECHDVEPVVMMPKSPVRRSS
jgi:hypothetical protein